MGNGTSGAGFRLASLTPREQRRRTVGGTSAPRLSLLPPSSLKALCPSLGTPSPSKLWFPTNRYARTLPPGHELREWV